MNKGQTSVIPAKPRAYCFRSGWKPKRGYINLIPSMDFYIFEDVIGQDELDIHKDLADLRERFPHIQDLRLIVRRPAAGVDCKAPGLTWGGRK